MFLSLGTQFSPLIAGYIIEAKGWQWFFKLTSILIGLNLLAVLLLVPETTYRRVAVEGESAVLSDPTMIPEKFATENIEDVENMPQHSSTFSELNRTYAGSYWQDLISFQERGLEPAGIRKVFIRAIEPFRFLAVPQVMFAGITFGALLGG